MHRDGCLICANFIHTVYTHSLLTLIISDFRGCVISCYAWLTCYPANTRKWKGWLYTVLLQMFLVRTAGKDLFRQTVCTINCKWTNQICTSRRNQLICMGFFGNDVGVLICDEAFKTDAGKISRCRSAELLHCTRKTGIYCEAACCSQGWLCLNTVWIPKAFPSPVFHVMFSCAMLRVMQKTIWNLIWAARASRLRHICKNLIGNALHTTSKCVLNQIFFLKSDLMFFFFFPNKPILIKSECPKKCWRSEFIHYSLY